MKLERSYVFDRNTGAEYYLDEYEQELEDTMELSVRYSPEEEKKMIKELVKMAKTYNEETKDITINIPVKYLTKLHHKAAKIGLSSKDYISKVLHEEAII